MYKVSVRMMQEEFKLTNLTEAMELDGIFLTYPEINRPALQLAGFYDYFDSGRLQIVGFVEHSYLEQLDPAAKQARLAKFFSRRIPCVVVCRNLPVSDEFVKLAYDNGCAVLRSDDATSDFMGEVIKWLKVELAPRIRVHGVLVDVYGEGILITGESGVGKSETALELVKRGHRLVADDSVEIKKVSNQTLVGSCPEILRYLIELRGIGVVDIRQMFGVASVKTTQNIDLVINLDIWDDNQDYDRMGLENEHVVFLGNKVVCYNVPVRPGRNLAIIIESAAINHRLKTLGYNAAETFAAKINQNLNPKNNPNNPNNRS